MGTSNYSSLTNRLIQNGILSSKDNVLPNPSSLNFFEECYDVEVDENNAVSPFKTQNPISENQSKKRLNKNDLELINSYGALNILPSKKSFVEKLYSKLFPRLYKAKQVRIAMQKMKELNISESELFSKIIPYGESEDRYNALIKYLNMANDIQVKLSKND